MIKFFKQNNKKSGFTLVETLIAISIFSVSIVALFSVLAQGISNTNYAKKKIIAGYLAQEGIEYIRNMRDSYVLYSVTTGKNWAQFKFALASCNPGNECGFNNSVYVTNPNFIFKCTTNLNGCNLYLNNGNYNSNSSGSDSGFTRKIWMSIVKPYEVKIFSKVSWMQGSGIHDITLTEDLFNWVE